MEEQNINEILEELNNDDLSPELVYDNKLHFKYKEEIYRVRLPNQKEHSNANSYKNQKYVQLLQQKDTLTIKQITKLLKEKQDIDISDLDKEAKKLETEMTQVYLTLAKRKDTETNAIEELKKQLKEIREKRLTVILEKAGLLAPAIENQVQDDYYRFLTAICTEKLAEKKEEKEVWNQVWLSFEEYEKDDTKLPYIALGRFTELMYGV
jgi:transposase